jgi:hypothetical protein
MTPKEDCELHRQRSHGVLPKQAFSKDGVRESIACLWFQRFGLLPAAVAEPEPSERSDASTADGRESPSADKPKSKGCSSAQEEPCADTPTIAERCSLDGEVLSTIEQDLVESLTERVAAFDLERPWEAVRAELHQLKGELRSLPDDESLAIDEVVALVERARHNTCRQADFASTWDEIKRAVQVIRDATDSVSNPQLRLGALSASQQSRRNSGRRLRAMTMSIGQAPHQLRRHATHAGICSLSAEEELTSVLPWAANITRGAVHGAEIGRISLHRRKARASSSPPFENRL